MSESWEKLRPAWILAIAILVGWLIGIFADGITICPEIPNYCTGASYYLAQTNALVVYYHQYYQLFSSMLITDSPLDAAFNAIAVLVLDRITEDSLNKTRYFVVFVTSALVGNLLTLINGPNYASAGASGGIFGIYAALITFSWLKEKKVDLPALILFIVIFLGSSILPNVNYLAHIGGAVGGFILGNLIYRSIAPSITEYGMAYESKRSTTVVVTAVIILVIAAAAIQFLLFSRT